MTTTVTNPEAPRKAIRRNQLRAADRVIGKLADSPWLTEADRQRLADRLLAGPK